MSSRELSFEEAKNYIKDHVDLASVIGKHTKLLKTATGFKGLCPLPGHKEKSPSFTVNTRENYFYCYGCNRGGDVFKFLEWVEGRPFVESLRELAQENGIKIASPKNSAHSKEHDEIKDKLQAGYDLLSRAENFFHQYLFKSNDSLAVQCRDYLSFRGISNEEAMELKLGAAPDSWSALTSKIKNSDEKKLALEIKLISQSKEGKTYDFFRKRLIIPIHDHRGRVVGFSGRTFDEVSSENPKYKNSPESEWFKKKNILYALDRAQKFIRDQGYVCLVEGFFDQWAFHRHGIPAVAVMGTAMGEDHLKLLERHTKQLIMVMDTDQAGIQSTLKSLPLLLSRGWDVKIFDQMNGKDPDEWLGEEALETRELKNRLLSSPEALTWWATKLIQISKSQKKNKLQILKDLKDVWLYAPHRAHQNILAIEISKLLNISETDVFTSLEDLSKGDVKIQNTKSDLESSLSFSKSQSHLLLSPKKSNLQNTLDRACEGAFVWWLQHWDQLTPKSHEEWERREKLFIDTPVEGFVSAAGAEWMRSGGVLPSTFIKIYLESEDSLDSNVRDWMLRGLVPPDDERGYDHSKVLKSFDELASRLVRERDLAEIKILQSKIENLSGNADEVAQLLQRIQELKIHLEKSK